MATIKAKKGNPFEYNVMYSFYIIDNNEVYRPDTNIKGIDLIVYNKILDIYYIIECKNRNIQWNELVKIYKRNYSNVEKFIDNLNIKNFKYYLVFKPKRTDVLVFDNEKITTFSNVFGLKYSKRPKGFNLNKLLIKRI